MRVFLLLLRVKYFQNLRSEFDSDKSNVKAEKLNVCEENNYII
jgi:hypothetical protein